MSRIEKPEIVEKAWGREIIMINLDEYCGKILEFKPGAKFSMHFHMEKQETWYVLDGTFDLTSINTLNATREHDELKPGDVFTVERGLPHQLSSSTGGRIVEISTKHFDHDSYRVERGDSQQ